MISLKSGGDISNIMATPYTSKPWCSCSFNGNASCNFTSGCVFSGGGQCSFSVASSACGS